MTSFLRLDPDLLAAAAEAGVEDTGEMERFRSWVERLPAREQQRWLLRAERRLESLRQGLRPGRQTSGTGTARQTGSPRP